MRVSLILLMLSAPAMAGAQARPAESWAALVQAAGAYARDDSVVGWSVVQVRGGQIVNHYEAGLADRSVGQKVDENTLYHWASTTKTMTAVAILKLRDRGLLSLDDKVTKWIPELRRVHNPFGSM